MAKRKQHPNSLANLRQAPPAEKGNKRALQHGAYAKDPRGLAAARAAIDQELEAHSPIASSADMFTRELAARAIARVRQIEEALDERGLWDSEGEIRPAVAALERATKQAAELLDKLGMNPRSRAALGVDLARQTDLATAMSEPDEVKRAELLRQAGVVDGTAEEVEDDG